MNKYINHCKLNSNNYVTFENDNPSIFSNVYDENGKIINNSNNNSNKKAYMVKINNERYHAINKIKPIKDKKKQLEQLLKQFTHKEITNYILRKVTY